MAAKQFLNLPNGLKMPIVGLGTWQCLDEEELEKALDTALEVGYRHIDTAYAYTNEKVIGRVLKRWFDSGKLKRDDLFITTKLPPSGVHQDRVELFIKRSLANLQLDYVDLYLVHHPMGVKYNPENDGKPFSWGTSEFEPVNDHVAIWKKMEEQVDLGRTKTIGLSNFNIKQIQKVLDAARIKPANLQIELHVYLQQKELVDFCHKNGITVVSYSTLGTPGTKAYIKKISNVDFDLPVLLEDPTVVSVAKKHSKTPGQILLKFWVQQNVAVIPKSVNPERIKQNISLFDFELDADDLKALRDLDRGENGRLLNFQLPKQVAHPDFPFK